MYQVLLVDYEALITDGLAEYLARRAPERFEILKAYSGAGALEIAGRMRVDILVTDIEMLGMDGLAVRRRVQALWPQCRAIFLTAHANFEYAYQAIQDPPAGASCCEKPCRNTTSVAAYSPSSLTRQRRTPLCCAAPTSARWKSRARHKSKSASRSLWRIASPPARLWAVWCAVIW